MASVESMQTIDTIMHESEHLENEAESAKAVYRSYKKKYRKMRVRFDEEMRRSNELYRMEQDANATIKRIAQFNSQLLDMLLDNNSCPQVPADKRLDLATPHPTIQTIPPLFDPAMLSSLLPSLETSSHRALQQTIESLVAEKAQQTATANPPESSKSLSSLLSNTPHPSTSKSSHIPSDAPTDADPLPLRYLTSEEIDNYLDGLDTSNSAAGHSSISSQEISTRNPHSVYNWLRVNMPKVFLQDGEGSERSSVKPAVARTTSKKQVAPAATPHKIDEINEGEEEILAYEGLDTMEGLQTASAAKAKGKRKRGADDEDGGYHPKQGRVEDGKGKRVRKSKPKKNDEGTPGGSAKRSRKSKGESALNGDSVQVKEETAAEP